MNDNGANAPMGLRPPQAATAAKRTKPVRKVDNNDGNNSDDEIKKMNENTKQYMIQHIARKDQEQPKMKGNDYSFYNSGRGRMQSMRGRGMNKGAALPPGYTCHRCRQKGHLISECPTNGNPDFDLKKTPKGIPKNLKKENLPEQVEDKFVKTNVNDEITYFDDRNGIMREFQCSLCQNPYENPVMMPCCKINFCWECALFTSQQSDSFNCPSCEENGLSINSLIPNTLLDKLTQLYKRECTANRFIQEVDDTEVVAKGKQDLGGENELPDQLDDELNIEEYGDLELNQTPDSEEPFPGQNLHLDKIMEEYTTDEEDLKILEDTLGLQDIEKDIKENEAPIKNRTPMKSSMSAMHKPPMGKMMQPGGMGMGMGMGMPKMMKVS